MSKITIYWFANCIVDLDQQISEKMVKDAMGWHCTDCDYKTKFNSNLYEHIESRHIDQPGYSCDICSKFCKTRNALRNHKFRLHK